MTEIERAESLSKLSLDYRVALAHSPIQPQQVHEAKAGWLSDKDGYICYGFVLRYRSRWVYLTGQRDGEKEFFIHTLQWFDEEPVYLYERAVHWQFDIGEILNGPYFLTDEEAGRPTPVSDSQPVAG